MTLEDALFEIEEGFWLGGRDYFLAHVDERCLLAFPQAGEMHGIHSRQEVAASAAIPNRWKDLRTSRRHLIQPQDGVAIVSYRADVTRADGMAYAALVSSAYVRRADGWKLLFHQHSPVEESGSG